MGQSGNLLTANEIVKTLSTRTWYQLGTRGARYFYGQPGYHFISGATLQTGRGGVEPVFAPDPQRPGRYRLISRAVSAPDLPEWTVDFHESWGGLPRHLLRNQCAWTFYELHSNCGDPSDFYRGWEGYVMIYADGLYSGGIDLGERTVLDGDNPLTDSATFSGRAIYPAAALNFGEEAATEVVVEVIDVVYGQATGCGACGSAGDGDHQIYALTRANIGSPSAPGQVVYSLNSGDTWLTATITGASTTAEPQWMDIAGNILAVGIGSPTVVHYTTLSSATGAPTTWTSWTATAPLQDIYVQSPTATYFSSTTGRIYRTSDIATAPTLLATVGSASYLRIHGYGETIVATAGSGGGVTYSYNNGATWTSGAAAGSGINQALAVVGPRAWWIGDGSGGLYYTSDGGLSYTTVSLPGAPTAILDIVFATPEVGWISATLSGVARLYATLDGGYSWTRDDATSRIVNWPTFQRARRIATPSNGTDAVNANSLTVGGLTTAGTDGLLLVGTPTLV